MAGKSQIERLRAMASIVVRHDSEHTLLLEGDPLPILAIKQIAHRLSASFVRFDPRLAFVSVHCLLCLRVSVFRFATRWTAVGKARFTRLQLELFRADSANFDRKCHPVIMITRIQIPVTFSMTCPPWWPSKS